MTETMSDLIQPKPWENSNGFRSEVQAWHPIYGLSEFRPRCAAHGIPDCSPLLNGCTRVIRAHALQAAEVANVQALEYAK